MLGSGTGFERAVSLDLAAHCIIDGGEINNMASQNIQLSAARRTTIRDLTIRNSATSGVGNGALALMDGCEDILVDNVHAYGGMQVFMLSATLTFLGIANNINFDRCVSRGARTNAFSTHNAHENWSVRRSLIEDCTGTAAIDNRIAGFKSIGNIFRRITGYAHQLRIISERIEIEQNTIEGASHGVYLDETGSSYWTDRFERVPSKITIKNNEMSGITTRGVSLSHPFLYDALVPTLGRAVIEGNVIELTSGTGTAIRVGGKWQYLSVSHNHMTGGNGSAQAIQSDDAGLGGVSGPLSGKIVDNAYGAGYAASLNVSTVFSADLIQRDNRQFGVTLPARALAASTTLVLQDVGSSFSNAGATALVVVTLPAAASLSAGQKRSFEFFVQDADGIQLQLTSSDTIQIGDGAASAANGTIQSTTIGSWIRITAIDSTRWIAEVDDPGNWGGFVHAIPGINVAASTTLTWEQGGSEFNNLGATALVILTLPGAASFTLEGVPTYKAFVSDADGIRFKAIGDDTIQIGSGAPGAAAGSITSTTIGAWCRITSISATKWIAEVDNPANWTVA
jgi:hypothetical protein